MEGNSMGCGVLVSVQAPGYEFNPVQGHRAAGFLADRDLVCVPSLPQSLLDEASTYDVLLVPVSGDRPEERHKISSVKAAGLEGSSDVAAFFRLTRPSSLFAPPQRTISEDEEFAATLQALDGDLWAFAGEVGLGNPPFRGDPLEILNDATRFLDVISSPSTTTTLFPTPEEVALKLCCFWWCDGC